MHPDSQGEMLMKRRHCTTCGVPGHTKRTCTSQRNHGVIGTDAGMVHSSAKCSSAKPSAPYAARRTQDADKDEGIQSKNGDNRQTVPDRAETNSTGSMHGCSHQGGVPTSFSEGNTSNSFFLHKVAPVTKGGLTE
ncbi:hypothetical protein AHAS_Ahas10G0083100 [Arachis hypogaea]